MERWALHRGEVGLTVELQCGEVVLTVELHRRGVLVVLWWRERRGLWFCGGEIGGACGSVVERGGA